MTPEDLGKAINQLKSEGASEEEILASFYKMFADDKLTLDELDGVVNYMGYHLTEEFKNMSPEDQKTKGIEKTDEPAEGVDEKDVEDVKEIPEDKPEEKSEDKPEDKPNEEDEEKEAMRLFGTK